MPHFVRDFTLDFDAAVAGLLPGYSGEPYALARFGDGEGAIMWGEEHAAKSDGWRWSGGSEGVTLPNRLHAAFKCTLPGWHVGLPSEEHEPLWHRRMTAASDVQVSRTTFAEIFCFANYQRFSQLDLRNCYKIGCSPAADWICPSTPQDNGWPYAIAECVRWILNRVHRPIIVSAGPWGKCLLHTYWKATENPRHCDGNRQTCIDVGSALSPSLHGRKTRKYHNRRSPKYNWKPKWSL